MKNDLKNGILPKALLGAVIIALVILCALLIQQYQHIRHLGYVAARHSLWLSLHGSGPLSTADASSTQAWMTFDYVGHVFKLRPDYLKTSLSIADTRYPRLTIADFAKSAGLRTPDALLEVQNAIRAYTASSSASAAATSIASSSPVVPQ